MSTLHRKNGFTLTELLVASMLISIVLTATYALFSGSIRTWRFMEQEYNVEQRMRNVVTLFGREIENLRESTHYLFEGDSHEITLYTLGEPMNLELGEGKRLMRVRYRYNPQRGQIIREEGIVSADLPPVPPQNQEIDRSRIKLEDESEYVMASHVADFRLRYVWVPHPPPRDPLFPPEYITPVYLSENRERWGYPQAVELLITLRDHEGGLHTTRSTYPLRLNTTHMHRNAIMARMQFLEEGS